MSPRPDPALPVPATAAGRAGLAAMLNDPTHALLAVDYDGVIAPIVADPSNAPPQPGAVAALARVGARLGSVAVITGRPAQVVVDYAEFARHPALADLVVFGHYGLQRWEARSGELISPPPPPALEAVRLELPGLLSRLGVTDAWIEDKVAAVSVHTRRSADPAGTLAALTPAVTECGRRHGLAVEPGRFVLEIRAPGVDKGETLRSYAQSRAARSVCYIGDDLADLPAFDAVLALRDSGTPGFTVASGSSEVTEVAQRADLVVPGPPGVVSLLTSLAEALVNAVDGG